MTTPPEDLTRLLIGWGQGDEQARESLIERLYPELRRLAASQLARRSGDLSVQATEVVHEAYLRLIDQREVQWQNRAHFFALAARLIRRLILDRARSKGRQKRGGGAVHVTLVDVGYGGAPDLDVLALDEALTALGQIDELAARIVELRFFAGLGVEETAEALGAGRTTVVRKWRYARAWLRQRLREGGGGGDFG